MTTILTTDGVAYEVGFGSNWPPGTTGVQHVNMNYVWARKIGTPTWYRSRLNMHGTITKIEQSTDDEAFLWLFRAK